MYQKIRSRQYDLYALKNQKAVFFNRSIPIIEPVRKIIKIDFLTDVTNRPFLFVVNPIANSDNGSPLDSQEVSAIIKSKKLLTNSNIIFAYIVHQSDTVKSLQSFVNEYVGCKIAFIHFYRFSDTSDFVSIIESASFNVTIEKYTGKDYFRNFPKAKNVLIEDGFNKKPRNKDYEGDEFYSTLFSTYRNEGLYGFGDFSIIGEQHMEGGGMVHAVAAHLSYKEANLLKIKHYVSTDVEGKSNRDIKTLDVLSQINNDQALFYKTKGLENLINDWIKQKPTGLGKIKEFSMAHHFELLSSLI